LNDVKIKLADSIPTAAPPKTKWIQLFRLLMAATVVVAIGYTAVKTSQQLQESDFDFRKVKVVWWFAAIAVYIAAMTNAWMFWHRVLLALGQHASPLKTLLAFFASQLGKYVPGKAMVVVIRTDMVRGNQVQTAPAAASVFIETLTWLFVGSVIGCLLLMFLFRDQTVLLISAALMALVAGGLTSPPVFRRIASRMNVARGRNANQLLGGLTLPTMAFGWGVMTIGWCLNGFSLWLVLYGIGGTEITLSDYPLTLACVCLATVAGFISLLPGGLGVRELVMIPMLGARFDSVTAVVAAVIIRLVWLSAELLTSGIIYVYARRRHH
jgi:uncharacterized membrane protein YbhN (UPF0104 family)